MDVDGKTQGVVVGVVKAEVKMEVDEEEEDLPLVSVRGPMPLSSRICNLLFVIALRSLLYCEL